MRFGPWMMPAFRVLAKLKGLRGTALDIFGHTEERKMERRLVEDYERTIGEIIDGLSRDNHAVAVEIAGLPESIRGYGHIKAKSMLEARGTLDTFMARFRAPAPAAARAA
jgi:indolepyruvate ferredoxin oxidoreductase